MSVKRLLQIHNFYRHPGGEESVLALEAQLLQEAGWELETFTVSSSEVQAKPWASRLRSYAQIPYSFDERARLAAVIKTRHFDMVHIHNLSPFLSSSVLDALPKALPRVMTLHNFRAFCVNGLFLRDGRPCEDCGRGAAWKGVAHRCHEGSLFSSAALVAARVAGQSRIQSEVDLFLCPSNFSEEKYRHYGFAASKLRCLRNFTRDASRSEVGTGSGLFLSRFSEEKGARVLAAALKLRPNLSFSFAGAGPLEEELRLSLKEHAGVVWLGWLNAGQMEWTLAASRYLVIPSTCYENAPIAGIQALAAGLPLVASRIGGLPELVRDGENGFLVEPGDAVALANAMERMSLLNENQWQSMGAASRKIYESNFTAEKHLGALEGFYAEATRIRSKS